MSEPNILDSVVTALADDGTEEAPSQPYLARLCRLRNVRYLVGRGLDIGCGAEKITPYAVGIDPFSGAASIQMDAGDLSIFTDDKMDYVFASHVLSYFIEWPKALMEWWKKLQPGHYMVIYDAQKGLWPRSDIESAATPLHNLTADDIIKELKTRKVQFQKVKSRIYADEKSFELVLCKEQYKTPQSGRKINLPNHLNNGTPSVLVCRYGGFGDHIFASALLPVLKEKGYYIIYNTSEKGLAVLKENPYIDEWLFQQTDVVPPLQLQEYWDMMKPDYSLFIQLNQSVEGRLLPIRVQPEFHWAHEKRHEHFNKNYYDYTFEVAGFPEISGRNGELYFSQTELSTMRSYFKKFTHKFVIVWALCGSALHKVYPYAPYVQEQILKQHPDVAIITVGGGDAVLLEEQMARVYRKCAKWTIRQSMLALKFADLVIGPETGILNAAGCFPTPKICLLSHSSKENLTKHWVNDYSLEPEGIACAPCHRLYRANEDIRDFCPHDPLWQAPVCATEGIHPDRLVARINEVYHRSK